MTSLRSLAMFRSISSWKWSPGFFSRAASVSDAARERFDVDHKIAERLYAIRLLALLGAVVATAAGIASRPSPPGVERT